MATVINTPSGTSDGSAGWAVAAVVLVAAVLLALFVWPGFVRNSAAPATGGTNINVDLPAGGTGAGSGGGSAAPAQ